MTRGISSVPARASGIGRPPVAARRASRASSRATSAARYDSGRIASSADAIPATAGPPSTVRPLSGCARSSCST
ncbi:hypothetical protein [Sphaerisporangium album]|uniref:hypothetical protein n=1 Tax=Sphaerisporangium album TaxID=509200 RepID=UPI0015F0757C|nr:hypothetical protein [Sphaerisporangium album]